MATSCCSPENPASTDSRPEIDPEQLALLCKALGHPARVRLLKHLSDYGACFFGNLADVLPLAPSTISQHVTILKEAGLIVGSANEQRMCYCINTEKLTQLKQLVQHF